VRTTDDIPNDLLEIKRQVLANPIPAMTVTSVDPNPNPESGVAAIVHGTWDAPDWRDGLNFKRDAAGRPVQVKTHPVAFILALPQASLRGPAPIVMYQHGNPGSSENEVPYFAELSLAQAGFAVIGFTDVLNREVSPGVNDTNEAGTLQTTALVLGLLENQKVPDYYAETNAEQIAFIRALQGLGQLDVLPVGAPDGVRDLDVNTPLLYLGISEGAVHAQALLVYAPEIRAAAVVVGGARLIESAIHQQPDAFVSQLGLYFPGLTGADIWVGFSLFQTIFDRQDSYNHAAFLYRHPLPIDGNTRKASILVTEGLTDGFVPNNATEALAWLMGPLPHLEPVQRPVPFLSPVQGPVMANIDSFTTAAFYQYVPAGVPGIDPTPGCETEPQGHFCPQVYPKALQQREVFFETALSQRAPVIIDPLAGD